MNKMTKFIIGLGSVICLVLMGAGVFSRGYADEFTTGPFATGVYMTSPYAFEASWLMGHRVVTPWVDDYLGQISGLVIDKTNNRIAAVVLSDLPNAGGSWDGNRHLILPYASIATDIGQDKCVFNTGNLRPGPSLEPNYVIGSDPWVYDLIIAGHPELYAIPATIDAAWLTDVYASYGQVPYWEVPGQPEPSLVLIDSSNLMGARIQLSSGEPAGQVNDLVITPDGRIAFVVLSDVPDRSTYTYVAVPFMALSTGENGFVLNVTGDQLASARTFDVYSDLSNPVWASNVYLYFGIAPSWVSPTPAPEQDGEY